MPVLNARARPRAASVRRQPPPHARLIAQWRALEARTRATSARKRRRCSRSAASCCRASASRGCSIPGAPFLELSTLAGWLPGHRRRRALGAGRRHDRGHRRRLGRARAWSSPSDAGIDAGALQAHGPGEAAARAGDRAREQAAVRAPGGVSAGANLLQVPRRAASSRRRALPQPGAAVRRRAAGDHGRARLVDGRRRLHAGPVRLRDHGARSRRAPSSPARRC